MIKSMKKRTLNKIKKLIPKIGNWSLWIGLGVFSIYISVHSFISLHNGASVRDISGRKYAPVISELLLMIGAVIFLLFILKTATKLKMIYIASIGIVLLGLIGWFAYWAFGFTHQDLAEGFLTLSIIIGSISVITAIALWREAHVRRKRDKVNSSRHKNP